MYIYLIRQVGTDYTKIGMADDLERRLKELQVGNPQELRIIGVILCPTEESALRLERLLHRLYRSRHIRGEWFDVSPIIIATDMTVLDLVGRIERFDVPKVSTEPREKAEKWMHEHPARMFENHRILAPIIGVSESTVWRVQKRFSENGTKKPEETDERPANK